MSRLIVLGRAKALTQGGLDGPYLEGVDPSDRYSV